MVGHERNERQRHPVENKELYFSVLRVCMRLEPRFKGVHAVLLFA